MTSDVATPSAGRRLIVWGFVAIGVGLLIGIVSFVMLVTRAVGAVDDQLNAPTLTIPGDRIVSLGTGRYLVFQLDEGSGVTLTHDDVTVKPADSGAALVPHRTTIGETIDRPEGEYVAFAGFDVPAAGDYVVTVGGQPGRVLVARGVVSQLGNAAGWFLGLPAGGLLVVAGIVLIAVGFTRRRRAREAAMPVAAGHAPGQPYAPAQPSAQPYAPAQPYAQPYVPGQPYAQPYVPGQPYPPAQQYAPAPPSPPAGPPPGWYADPDPSRPGGQRYWDGSAWTGHVG